MANGFPNAPEQLLNIIKDTDTVSVLIDGYSATQACKTIDIAIDWTKFGNMFREVGRLRKLHFYIVAPYQPDNCEQSWVKLQNWLVHNSFTVTSRTGYPFSYEVPHRNEQLKESVTLNSLKTGIEICITSDAMLEAHKGVDHVVLFTTNDDYAPLVENLQSVGTTVTVICNSLNAIKKLRGENNGKNIPNAKIPVELIASANNLLELTELESFVCMAQTDEDKE